MVQFQGWNGEKSEDGGDGDDDDEAHIIPFESTGKYHLKVDGVLRQNTAAEFSEDVTLERQRLFIRVATHLKREKVT